MSDQIQKIEEYEMKDETNLMNYKKYYSMLESMVENQLILSGWDVQRVKSHINFLSPYDLSDRVTQKLEEYHNLASNDVLERLKNIFKNVYYNNPSAPYSILSNLKKGIDLSYENLERCRKKNSKIISSKEVISVEDYYHELLFLKEFLELGMIFDMLTRLYVKLYSFNQGNETIDKDFFEELFFLNSKVKNYLKTNSNNCTNCNKDNDLLNDLYINLV
ncbi:MAG: hypothetical protein QXR30_02840 [Candidatus Woesearchaeota archaeon]